MMKILTKSNKVLRDLILLTQEETNQDKDKVEQEETPADTLDTETAEQDDKSQEGKADKEETPADSQGTEAVEEEDKSQEGKTDKEETPADSKDTEVDGNINQQVTSDDKEENTAKENDDLRSLGESVHTGDTEQLINEAKASKHDPGNTGDNDPEEPEDND